MVLSRSPLTLSANRSKWSVAGHRPSGGLPKDALLGSASRAGHVDPSGLVRPLELVAQAASLGPTALDQLLEALEASNFEDPPAMAAGDPRR
jgi:hypothetical protein